MSKKDQLKKMATIIAKNVYCIEEPDISAMPNARNAAKELFDAGYNKESQWVSVNERLPEIETATFKGRGGYLYSKSTRVLCACKQESGLRMVKEGYYEINLSLDSAPYWRIPGTIDSVTHWMPLPSLPEEG